MFSRKLSLALLALVAACGGGGDSPAPDASADAAQQDATAQRCTDNAACDDGSFCNGAEECGADGYCSADPVNCDDGIACTADRCSETARACRHDAPDVDRDDHADATCLDAAGDPLGDDCDDDDALRFPGNVESCDADNRDEDCNPETRGGRDHDDDGFEDALCCNPASDDMNAALVCGDDCDDFNASVRTTATEICDKRDNDCDQQTDEGVEIALYPDMDRDGHGATGAAAQTGCAGSPGLSRLNDDCDDDNVTRHGGQAEICDGLDNDCDPNVDESPTAVPWYLDADGDGFGDARDSVTSCDPVPDRSLLSTDCDDDNAMVSPRAAEACDGIDNDCNGLSDYPIGTNDFEDDDNDGVADDRCLGGTDCNDRDSNTAEGATEICDGTDNDCDDRVDENTPTTVWYIDQDRDGYGNSRLPASAACFLIPGRTARPGDCDDDAPENYPTNDELCDNLDNDCDREVDEDCRVVIGMDAGTREEGGVAGTGGTRTDGGAISDATRPGVDAADDGGGGSSGSSGNGGSSGSGGSIGVDGGVVILDAGSDGGVGPLPEIPCTETTLLDGSANVVNLTTSNVAGGVNFCGLYGQKVAIQTGFNGGGCATFTLLDVEDTVVFTQFGCGTFYVEQTLPGSRPYRAQLSAPTVPQTVTINIWDVPTLPVDAALLNATAFTRTAGVGQVVRWSFDATMGERITLSSTGPGCRDMALRGPGGVQVSTLFVCGAYELINLTVPATGSYELSSDSTNASAGQHALTGWVLGPDAALAASLGGSIAVPIPAPGNNGRIGFGASTGQRISIVATNVGCTTFRLASPTDVTVRTEFACGTWFTDVLTLTETGEYTLYVDPSGLSTGSSMITTYLLAPDPIVAAMIEEPTAVGSIGKPGNNMSFTFDGNSGKQISALVGGPGCNTYTLWSPTSTSLGTQFACGTWFLERFILPATGTYTVTVDPNGAQVGATNATFYTVSADPIVPAATDGMTVMSSVDRPGNFVTYEFTGNAAQLISLRGSGPGCNTFTLFDMNNISLVSQLACGEWFLENFTLPAMQTYAVRVDPNSSQTGATQLTVYAMPADTMAPASVNGGVASTVITTPGQNARFTFAGTASQAVTLQATAPGCYTYTLRDPLNTILLGPTLACGALNQANFVIAMSGTHTMLLDPSGTATGTTTFSVTAP